MSQSIETKKRSGATPQPCLTPLNIGNHSELEPSTLTQLVVSDLPEPRQQHNEVSFRNTQHFNPNAAVFRPRADRAVVHEVPESGKDKVGLFEALQLPKLDPITFDGNPLRYWSFIRSFEQSVEKYCNEDVKLMRLTQSTVGKASLTAMFVIILHDTFTQCATNSPLTDRWKLVYRAMKQSYM